MPNLTKTEQKYLDELQTKQLWFGEIRSTKDASRMGRMLVYIPDITGSDTSDTALFDCAWTSPFAGATQYSGNPADNDGATQTSYGMWMRPPDPGTQVVVGLIQMKGIQEPVILSCLFQNYRNFMVPGIPASSTPEGPNPSTEININKDVKSHNVKYTVKGSDVDVKSDTRPKSKLADNLFYQGLGDDFIRGQTTSGARREDNSEVFGILTPGNRKSGNPTRRNPGHQFVMDDNEANNLIRLRTGQGMQFLLNDTHNIIYIINKTGTGYVEIDGDGNIDIFGKGSFNVRTTGDLNLRADQNVNIEAGQDVNIKAANNSPHPYDESRGLGGIVDDIELALMDPMFGPDFKKANNKGTVKIEGQKQVEIIGKNIGITAMPSLMGIAEGTDGKIKVVALGSVDYQVAEMNVNAVGRVSQAGPTPGSLYMQSTGPAQLRGTTLTLNATIKNNIEGPLVDIATMITPPNVLPLLKPSDYIKTSFKKNTLFGFETLPIPVPMPGQPDKQVQGSGLPTSLGKSTDPTSPPIPAFEGTLFGGVKTIITRMPQPEPSKSKKDKPLKG